MDDFPVRPYSIIRSQPSIYDGKWWGGVLGDYYWAHHHLLDVIDLIASAMALLFFMVISVISWRKMWTSPTSPKSRSTNHQVQVMFFVSLFLAISTSITFILYTIQWYLENPFIAYGWVWFHVVTFLFYLSLLGNLVLRLRVTFGSSTYRMSKCTIVKLTVIVVAECCCLVLYIYADTVLWDKAFLCNEKDALTDDKLDCNDANRRFARCHYSAFASFVVLFIMGTIVSVKYFVGNLIKLARLQATSLRNLTPKVEDIPVNWSQQRMIDLSAKYLLLYFVAISSTFVSVLTTYVLFGQMKTMGGILFALDCCINVVCLYLQWNFSLRHYERLCCCLDKRCKNAVSGRLRKTIHAILVSRQDAIPADRFVFPSINDGYSTVPQNSGEQTSSDDSAVEI